MTQEQLDDKISGKLKRVTEYMNGIKGKTFGEEHEGGLNMMAKAVLFSLFFKEMIDYIHLFTSREEESRNHMEEDANMLRMLDHLIDIYGSSDATMKLFWDGGQSIKPNEIPFVLEDGSKTLINLNEIKEIKI